MLSDIDNYDYHIQERIFRKVISTNYCFIQVLIMCCIRWVCLFLLVCWFTKDFNYEDMLSSEIASSLKV